MICVKKWVERGEELLQKINYIKFSYPIGFLYMYTYWIVLDLIFFKYLLNLRLRKLFWPRRLRFKRKKRKFFKKIGFKRKTWSFLKYSRYVAIISCNKKKLIDISTLLPIGSNLFEKMLSEYYYKSKKFRIPVTTKNIKLKLKHIFFNVNKPTYRLFYLARKLQWSLFGKGSVRKQRYVNFAKTILKSSEILNNQNSLMYALIYWKKLNWYLLKKFTSIMSYTNIFVGGVVQLPINIRFKKKLKKLKIKYKNFLYKARKWSYLRYKAFVYQWMNLKKKLPKYFNKLKPLYAKDNKSIYYDTFTNSFFHIQPKIVSREPNLFIKKPLLLKLYAFRYNV